MPEDDKMTDDEVKDQLLDGENKEEGKNKDDDTPADDTSHGEDDKNSKPDDEKEEEGEEEDAEDGGKKITPEQATKIAKKANYWRSRARRAERETKKYQTDTLAEIGTLKQQIAELSRPREDDDPDETLLKEKIAKGVAEALDSRSAEAKKADSEAMKAVDEEFEELAEQEPDFDPEDKKARKELLDFCIENKVRIIPGFKFKQKFDKAEAEGAKKGEKIAKQKKDANLPGDDAGRGGKDVVLDIKKGAKIGDVYDQYKETIK